MGLRYCVEQGFCRQQLMSVSFFNRGREEKRAFVNGENHIFMTGIIYKSYAEFQSNLSLQLLITEVNPKLLSISTEKHNKLS